jgi:2-C-methyl-D-erythritol 4-phosphate cytidylyltransferase
MTVAALVLGAGRGERFRASRDGVPGAASVARALPKALISLGGRSLLARSLAAFSAVPEVTVLQPVLSQDGLDVWSSQRPEWCEIEGLAAPVLGGAERQDSVRCGLSALPADIAWVAVHDAARPLVQAKDITRVVEAARVHGAALLATPVVDTIHRVENGQIVETPERASLWAAATPQVFRRDWLSEALLAAETAGIVGTDDAGLVARLGHRVEVVPGDASNLKVTTEADRLVAERWLERQGENS